MKSFGLTEEQADDILDLRLRQLARLEGIKIEQELKELKAERKTLKHIFIYFDNDQAAYAANNALTLKEMVFGKGTARAA